MEYYLNIGGTEWIIIIFAALVLILGTNKLPEAARKLGKASAEYKKAKNEVDSQINEYTNQKINITGPVQNERQKLELMAQSVGIDPTGKNTAQLRVAVNEKIGQKRINEET